MFAIHKNVKAISFDIWNTLLRGNKDFTKPRLRLIFNLLGHEDLCIEKIVFAYKRADPFYDQKSELTEKDYGMAARLHVMFNYLKINDPVPDEATIADLQEVTGALRRWPAYRPTLIEADLVATLEKLRAEGYKLGLLSNTGMDNGTVMKPLLEVLGIWHLFDVAIFSSDDGRAKPNPDLFLRIAAELGAEPWQVLHIGDNVNADYPARNAGLKSVLYLPDGDSGLPYIRSMKELLNK